MGFAEDAIGFYLELEDRMTERFPTIERKYGAFVKDMGALTKKVNKTATDGVAAYMQLFDQLEDLPSSAVKSYAKSQSLLQKQIKGLTVPVKLEFTTTSLNAIKKALGKGMTDVLADASLRLSATSPLRKSGLFDSSVSLKALYKQQPQPPDMKGFFQGLPKFAEGGIVPNQPGANPNMDSILAMLTPGEMVLPKDVVKGIQDETSGQFVGISADFKQQYADMLNLSKAVDQLTGEISDNGGSVESTEKYTKALEALKIATDNVIDMSNDYAGTTLDSKMDPALRMVSERTAAFNEAIKGLKVEVKETTPQLEDATDALTGMRVEAKKIAPELEDAADEITGVADAIGDERDRDGAHLRFLSLAAAVTLAREGFNQLTSSATQAFDTMDGQQIGGFVESMDEANRSLGMTRSGLIEFKRDLGELTSEFVSYNDVGAAAMALTNAGVTDESFIKQAIPSMTLMANATTASIDLLGQLNYQLVNNQKLSQGAADAVMAQVAANKLLHNTAPEVDAILTNINELVSVGGFGAAFQNMTDDQKLATLQSYATLTQSLGENWAEFDDVFKGAMSGDIDAQNQLAALSGMTGDDLTKNLAARNTDGIIQAMVNMANQLPDDAMSIQQFANSTSIAAESIIALKTNGQDMIETSRKIGETSITTANAQDYLQEATENSTRTFERLTNAATSYIGKQEVMGVSGTEVISFMKEFNPMALLAVGHIAMMGVHAGIAAGKFALMTGGVVLGGMARLLGLLRSTAAATAATSAAAGSGAGAGSGGFLKGLAGGIAAFANPATIAGLAVLVGAASILMLVAGASLRIAGDALGHVATGVKYIADAVGGVVTSGIDRLFEFLDGLTGKDPRQLIGTGVGMTAIGVGVVSMAASFAIAGSLLVVGLPGFVLLAALFGSASETGVLGGVLDKIEQVASQFAGVSTRLMLKAGLGVLAVGGFMLAFGIAMIAIAAGSMLGAIGKGAIMFVQMLEDADRLPSDDATVSHLNALGATWSAIQPRTLLKGGLGLLATAAFAVAYGVGMMAIGIGTTLATIGKAVTTFAITADHMMELPADRDIVSHFNNLGAVYSKLDRATLLEGAKGLAALALFGVAMTVGFTMAALGKVAETVAMVTVAVTEVIANTGELDTPSGMVRHFNGLADTYSKLNSEQLIAGGRGLNALARFGIEMTAGLGASALGQAVQLGSQVVSTVATTAQELLGLETPIETVIRINNIAGAYNLLNIPLLESAGSKFGGMMDFMLKLTGANVLGAGMSLADFGASLVAGAAGWGRSITDFVGLTEGPADTARRIQSLATEIDNAINLGQLRKSLTHVTSGREFLIELSGLMQASGDLNFEGGIDESAMSQIMARSITTGAFIQSLSETGKTAYSTFDESSVTGLQRAAMLVAAYRDYVNALGGFDSIAVINAERNAGYFASMVDGSRALIDSISKNADVNALLGYTTGMIGPYDALFGALNKVETKYGVVETRAQSFADAIKASGSVIQEMRSQLENDMVARADIMSTQETTIRGRVEASDPRTHELLAALISAVNNSSGGSGGTPSNPSRRPSPQTREIAGQRGSY